MEETFLGVFSYRLATNKGLKAIKRFKKEEKQANNEAPNPLKSEKASSEENRKILISDNSRKTKGLIKKLALKFGEKNYGFFRKTMKNLRIFETKTIKYIKQHRAKILLSFFRKDSAISVVFITTTLVTAGNLNFKKEQSGFLFASSGKEVSVEEMAQKRTSETSVQKGSLTMAPLTMNTTIEKEEDINDIVMKDGNLSQNQMQYQVLTAVEPPDAKKLLSQGADVSVYEVRQNDTVSTIAQDFGVTTNTILWANDLDDPDMIQPGDKIFILPITGVKHIVKSGDTLKKIADKYEADEQRIIAFNELPADGNLKEGEEIVIPGGSIEQPAVTPGSLLQERNYYSSSVVQDDSRGPSVIDRNPKGGHSFPYGYCTWYVASKKYVPWGGNAGTWLYNARAYGVKTGKTPKAGAIIVTNESWYGHVGIVTKVKGSNVTIKEMNYRGYGVVSSRTISSKSRVIKGYIY